MGGCCAQNCSNHSSKGFRLFRFPSDPKRRQIWIDNCKRKNWKPTNSTKLCEAHFEDSQYELKRADGRKLLRWNAVPTIFDIPNPPKKFCSPDKFENSTDKTNLRDNNPMNNQQSSSDTNDCSSNEVIKQLKLENENLFALVTDFNKRIEDLSNRHKEEIENMKEEIGRLTEMYHTFIDKCRIESLSCGKLTVFKMSIE